MVYHARIQVFLGGDRTPPPLRLSAILCCLLICPGPCNNLNPLLKFLYETPPSECTNPPPPPLLNPGSAPGYSQWNNATTEPFNLFTMTQHPARPRVTSATVHTETACLPSVVARRAGRVCWEPALSEGPILLT